MKALLTLAAILIVGATTTAQIIINEYSCSNMSGPTDAYGEREDWVELHNAGASPVDITGYFLSDKNGNLQKWQIPTYPAIPAGGYAMVYFSGRGTINGSEIHPSFGLTQTSNEWIILTAPSGSVADSLCITMMTQTDHSYGRSTDASSTWSLFTTPTPNASNTGADPYYTPTPTMSVAPGFYSAAQSVSLSCSDATATIYYTLDGSVPTTSSTAYSGPINIPTTTVLRARAFNGSNPPSFIESNTYFINSAHTIPVLSIYGDLVEDFINDVAPGSFSSDFLGGFEYFEADGSFIDEGVCDYNKHGNDSWAYDQRGFDLIVRDQYGYNNGIQHQIFAGKTRDNFQRLIVKAAANDNYSFENGAHLRDAYVHTLSQIGDLRMDERTSVFGIVYVNGLYWGVYDFREKVDDADFTDYYYNQGKFDIDFIKTWGGTWAEYGDQVHWQDLYNYITTNNMAIQSNYDYVDSLYNVGSLIDYTVLNSYIVTSDWLNWNTAWWHGHVPEVDGGDKQKFRYVLWDMDASFGHYINYTGVPSTAPDADPCNVEGLSGSSDPQGHMTILNALMANPEFQQQYITRYADLSNGIFSCDMMHQILDSMVAVLQPEMQGQCTRWGGTVSGWQANVQALKDYIDDRCAAISTGMVDCYNLTGPFDLTVNVEPASAGEVKVNSIWVPNYPWTGTYYGNINTLFKANAFAGYQFDYWESTNHTFANPDSLDDTLDLTMNDSIIAHFKVIETTPPVNPPGVPPGDYPGFHLPSAFSPNGDLNNDVLQYFLGYDVQSFDLQIYDRWGNLVFQTQTNGEYWDGTYKGKLLNSGVYTYTLTYTLVDAGKATKTGNITLIR